MKFFLAILVFTFMSQSRSDNLQSSENLIIKCNEVARGIKDNPFPFPKDEPRTFKIKERDGVLYGYVNGKLTTEYVEIETYPPDEDFREAVRRSNHSNFPFKGEIIPKVEIDVDAVDHILYYKIGKSVTGAPIAMTHIYGKKNEDLGWYPFNVLFGLCE